MYEVFQSLSNVVVEIRLSRLVEWHIFWSICTLKELKIGQGI